MAPSIKVDPHLTRADRLVLSSLLQSEGGKDAPGKTATPSTPDSGYGSTEHSDDEVHSSASATESVADAVRQRKAIPAGESDGHLPGSDDESDAVLAQLRAMNDPADSRFETSVFATWDLEDVKLPGWIDRAVLKPYIRWAQTVARLPTDVIIVTHIITYLGIIVPSAVMLFRHFSYIHAIAHLIFVGWCIGPYTLMRHQHIHMRGVLSRPWAALDLLFPYILDPMIGHTWNSYYYHHVKHHHVEGNGPGDLSSTIRYQRDSLAHFMLYFLRFATLIWVELPTYFIKRGKAGLAARAAFWEFSDYALVFCLAKFVNTRAAVFVFVIPFCLLRFGLMVGNWGQHALVDEVDPASDFRSSITLLDVPSNRYSFNDGYHTSHHLNPLRHWREHPHAFFAARDRYAREGALVFANIDYIMLTIRLLRKDYDHLARYCFVPIGEEQKRMSVEQVAAMLQTKTRAMSEDEIRHRFR